MRVLKHRVHLYRTSTLAQPSIYAFLPPFHTRSHLRRLALQFWAQRCAQHAHHATSRHHHLTWRRATTAVALAILRATTPTVPAITTTAAGAHLRQLPEVSSPQAMALSSAPNMGARALLAGAAGACVEAGVWLHGVCVLGPMRGVTDPGGEGERMGMCFKCCDRFRRLPAAWCAAACCLVCGCLLPGVQVQSVCMRVGCGGCCEVAAGRVSCGSLALTHKLV